MSKYTDFQDKPINKTLSYIHWFFVSNIYFMLCNILLIASALFIGFKFKFSLLFFISLIPTGPALTALFSFTNKLITDKYVDTTRDYFKGYSNNLLISLKVWLIFLIISFILILDLKLCFNSGKFLFLLLPLFIIMISSTAIISYTIPIISKYQIKLLDSLKLSIYLVFNKPVNTLINLGIIAFSLYILIYSNGFIALIISSISCYLINLNLKSSYLFINNKYLNKQ